MMVEAINGIRVRLQRRWRRARGADRARSFYATKVLRDFILEEPACRAIVDRLQSEYPDLPDQLHQAAQQRGAIHGEDEREGAALGWVALNWALEQGNQATPWHRLGAGIGGVEEAIEQYLEPLFDFLDEALDDRAEVLNGLLRFQQWASWFGYPRIAGVIAEEDQVAERGGRRQVERRLQNLMFERLFLDGLSLTRDVTREPDSGVGRPDFIFWFHSRPIVSEVKLFPGSGGVPGLASGFNQLLTYMDEYQSSVGYLVIFNTDRRGLRCAWTANHGGVPYVTVGDKTVYVMIVAATGDDRPASKRGKADPVWIKPEELHPDP